MRSGGDDRSQNRCRSRRRKRSGFKVDFNNPLEVILQVPNHGGVGGARSNKQSDNNCNSGSKSTCCGGRKGAMVATLGRGSASKLISAVKRRILGKTMTSGGSSHQAGWMGALT